MSRFNQMLLPTDTDLMGFFDDTPGPIKDAVGVAATAIGGFTLVNQVQQFASTQTVDPDAVSLGLFEVGGGLLMTRNFAAKNTGKSLIVAGVVYDLANKAGLLKALTGG